MLKRFKVTDGPFGTTPPFHDYRPFMTPKVSFSQVQGEVSYAQWKQEIIGLQAESCYTDMCLLSAIRKSTKGTAADILLQQRPLKR